MKTKIIGALGLNQRVNGLITLASTDKLLSLFTIKHLWCGGGECYPAKILL